MRPLQYPLRTDTVTTRIIEAGRGGLPIVMVHGMGARADRWHGNVVSLGEVGFHCIAMDLPGHGLAQKGPSIDFRAASLAAFLRDSLDALDIRRCLLMGTSLGGLVCTRFACDSRDRVAGLILVGSLGFHELPREARKRMSRSLTDNSADGVQAKLSRLLFDQNLVTEDWIHEECRVNGSPGAPEALGRLADHILAEDGLNAETCGPELAALTPSIPTLLVWGAEERSVPLSVGKSAHDQLPGSEFVALPKAGHLPYFEQLPAFQHVLMEFLIRHGAEIRGRL